MLTVWCLYSMIRKGDSIHHHLLEAISETAAALELRQVSSAHHPLWVVVVVYRIGLPNDALML